MLDLNDLSRGLPAITPSWGATLAEMAGVCLESQGHEQGAQLRIIGYTQNSYTLSWPDINYQTLQTWRDLQEATQFGATAIAVLLGKVEVGYSVVERSVKGTGIDYWMGDESDGPPFQHKARLEISGILRVDGDSRTVRRRVSARVREKLKQTDPSDGLIPAYVIVVEFGSPIAEVQRK